MKSREKLAKHKYELPCANCKALVTLSPFSWLRHFRSRRLPFCLVNGCKKYRKFLSADPKIKENEDEFYGQAIDHQREGGATPQHAGAGGRDALQENLPCQADH